jgi:hypothetical protein
LQGREVDDYFEKEWKQVFYPEPKQPASLPILDSDWDKLLALCEKICKNPNAHIFLYPVDKTLYPDYYDKITSPIDLSVIRNKTTLKEYSTLDQAQSDYKLLFSNCYTYNPKGSAGRKLGTLVEGVFKKEWKAFMNGRNRTLKSASSSSSSTVELFAHLDIPMESLKEKCAKVLKRMQRHPFSAAFLEPVPTSIPGYHALIKEPMDLGTVHHKLHDDAYGALNAFTRDVQLVFDNCMLFNAKASVFQCIHV